MVGPVVLALALLDLVGVSGVVAGGVLALHRPGAEADGVDPRPAGAGPVHEEVALEEPYVAPLALTGREPRAAVPPGSAAEIHLGTADGLQVLSIHIKADGRGGAEVERYLPVPYAARDGGAFEVAGVLRQAGVVAAMGHTASDFDTASRALSGDFTHSTHTFNAQSGFNHRSPGAVGAVLASDTVTAEVIADGVHVHPAAIKILVRCLGPERVVLVTDSMPAASLPDGEYSLVGQQVTVHDGTARLPDGTLAGSTATMPGCIKIMHQQVGVPLYQALQMASLNPARVLGMEDQFGSLQPGLRADLVVLDGNFNVLLTMVNGEIVFNQLS